MLCAITEGSDKKFCEPKSDPFAIYPNPFTLAFLHQKHRVLEHIFSTLLNSPLIITNASKESLFDRQSASAVKAAPDKSYEQKLKILINLMLKL